MRLTRVIYFTVISCVLFSAPAGAQVDRHDLRAGNRDFRKGELKEAEIDYRRAVGKDSLSQAGQYNLANSMYRQEDYEGARKAYEASCRDGVSDYGTARAARRASGNEGTPTLVSDSRFNAGDAALQMQDYAAAVKAFREALLANPDDITAKENYIYAKLKLEDQQNQDQNQNQNQNQDQQNQNQDQSQDQNQDQQDQNQQDQDQPQPQNSNISPQQAQQMLQAIQAKEKETQDKVNKEKAAAAKARRKDKNW